MVDLETLAGRIVLVHHGAIAFEGDFVQLRRAHFDRRRLVLNTPGSPPVLSGAQYLRSDDGRHQYVFDGSTTPVGVLAAQASA